MKGWEAHRPFLEEVDRFDGIPGVGRLFIPLYDGVFRQRVTDAFGRPWCVRRRTGGRPECR